MYRVCLIIVILLLSVEQLKYPILGKSELIQSGNCAALLFLKRVYFNDFKSMR